MLSGCLLSGGSWAENKAHLLDEYFPYFVWERLISDLIVSYFQNEGLPLRAYIEQVFLAAEFLEYKASEQQLVDRIVMKFHPSILAHAAFLDKPRSLKALYRVVDSATSRTVSGSIPGGVTGDFIRSYRQNHVSWGRLSL